MGQRQPIEERGIKVMQLKANGVITKQIANQLGLSHRTVENTVKDMLFLYDCVNGYHLIATLLRQGKIQ